MITREEDAVRLPAGGQHPRQHPVLHQPRPGVHHQGPRHAGGQPAREGPADHQPAGRPGRPGRVRQRDHLAAPVRAGPLPGHGHPAGQDQEDLAGRLRQDQGQRADRDQPGQGRRAALGGPLERVERHPHRHPQRPGSALHRTRGPRHGPGHDGRHRHPAQGRRRGHRHGGHPRPEPAAAGGDRAGLRQADRCLRLPDQAPGHRRGDRELPERGHRQGGRGPAGRPGGRGGHADHRRRAPSSAPRWPA